MIEFNYETDFKLTKEVDYSDWINRIIISEGFVLNNINYIFCDDAYLLELNQKHLHHDTYTDIITFNYSEKKTLSADIFISVERVRENTDIFNVDFKTELLRVMIHGILHLIGYDDKSEEDKILMRKKENEKIKLFHVEHN